jgi:UDP-glucose 4-epimerase
MITLTGSEGFIGSHINFANERIDIKGLQKHHDICRIHDYAGDVIIHLAAISSVQQSMHDIAAVAKVNIWGLTKVIKACQKSGKRLIFASSSAVVDPQSPYAYSKLWGEELIKMSGIDYAILRFGNVYGDGDDKSAIHLFEKADTITIYGNGNQKRSFIHVDDVVAAINFYAGTTYRGTFNIGNENLSINEVAAMFNKPIQYAPERKGDNMDSTMRSDWKCEYSLANYVSRITK